MKIFLLASTLLFSGFAFAEASATYKCGPYEVELDGPNDTYLSLNGEVLHQWHAEGVEPLVLENNTFFLTWDGQKYPCAFIEESP